MNHAIHYYLSALRQAGSEEVNMLLILLVLEPELEKRIRVGLSV